MDLILTDIRMPDKLMAWASSRPCGDRIEISKLFYYPHTLMPTASRPQMRNFEAGPYKTKLFSVNTDSCFHRKMRLTRPALNEPHASSNSLGPPAREAKRKPLDWV